MARSANPSLRLYLAASQLLLERSLRPILILDRDTTRILVANPAASRLYGYSVPQLLGLTLSDLQFDRSDPRALELLALVQSIDPPPVTLRAGRHRTCDGRAIELVVKPEDLPLGPGRQTDAVLRACMLTVRDISPRRRAAEPPSQALAQPQILPDSISDAFFSLDRDDRFVSVNQRAEELLRIGRDQLLGRSVWEVFPEALHSGHFEQHQRAVATRQPLSFEAYFAPWQVWHEGRIYPSEQGVSVFFRDITERKQMEQLRQQDLARLQAIVNASGEAILSVNPEGKILSFNPAAERTFGVTSEQMLGRSVEQLLPERFRLAHPQQLANFADSSQTPRMMGLRLLKGLHAQGHEIDLEGSIAQARMGDEKVLITVLRDVTARLAIDAEHKAARAQLSQLTHKLMSQEKDLVKRIAQALHDRLGQTLAAIRLVYEAKTFLHEATASEELRRLNQQLGALIDQAIREVRLALVDLRPPLLDDHGLAAALDNELRSRAHVRSRMNISLHVPPQVAALRWPPAVEYAVFMVAREAIENALRHSGGTELIVKMNGTTRSLELNVMDNGLGFVQGTEVKVGHLGVGGMLERAKSIGASVAVTPRSHGGTRVSLRWGAAS